MTGQTASSLAEFYNDPTSPYAAFPQQHRSGGSLSMSLMRIEQDLHTFTDPGVPELVLVLSLRSDMPFRWDVGDGWSQQAKMQSGHFSLIPADTVVEYECLGRHDVLTIAIPKTKLGTLLEQHNIGSIAAFDPLTNATLFRDETVRRTVMQMWTESARSGGTSDLLIDGLTQVLIARLLDKAGALRRPQPILPLSPDEMMRLDAVVEARLVERLTVEDLARTFDMPRWTFADAFKATTGETPHTYVTGKRIEKACELLRVGDMPLAEIAYAVGFASQSHMTDTFRRVLGTTPGAWRREVRS